MKDVLILNQLDNFCLTPELKFAIFTFAKVWFHLGRQDRVLIG